MLDLNFFLGLPKPIVITCAILFIIRIVVEFIRAFLSGERYEPSEYSFWGFAVSIGIVVSLLF